MGRWCLRHPALAGMVACVAILLIALAAGGIVTARRERVLRDLAEANLARARQVVNEMYTQVGLADDQAEMDEYQRDILQKALHFYEEDALRRAVTLRCGTKGGGRPCGPATSRQNWAGRRRRRRVTDAP